MRAPKKSERVLIELYIFVSAFELCIWSPRTTGGPSVSQMEVYMLLRPIVEVIEMSRQQTCRLKDGLLKITRFYFEVGDMLF